MKKVISLFLTVVMALSMFSCLSVMAGAATSDLFVDQEYTIASGTTKIFVPEESGYYKFESNGNGDPMITITCLNGEYTFDDEIDRDFSGVVELEAGEEVSCCLYNYIAGANCVFTITKVVLPESVSVSFIEPIEILENTNGEWSYESVWNEELGDYEEVEYYCYYTPFQYYEGNTITINYADGTSDVYTCDGMDYLNSSGNGIAFSYYANQSYENRWTVGSDNYFIVEVMGVQTQVPVTIIENPYESIEFVLAEPIEIMEYTNGNWTFDELWDDETGECEEVEYYRYDTPNIHSLGNSIVVNYTDGTSDVYAYDFYSGNFVNSSGDTIDFNCYDNQSYNNQWTVDSDNYFIIQVFGKETQVPVTIIENPYESIEFVLAEPIEIMEYTNGNWTFDELWNDETGEYEYLEYYFYDTPNIYSMGNSIIVNYTDGTSDVYTYDDMGCFVNSSGDTLDFNYYDNQSYNNQWTVDSDNYLIIQAFGKEAQIPVTIIENPYESIEFVPAEPIEIVEYTNGSWMFDELWDDETGESEEVEYYCYDTPDICLPGNSVTVNYTDGTSDVYTYDDMGCFVNSSGDILEVYCSYNQSYNNQWTVGSDNYFIIQAFGKETQVPVTIIENPYESIEFVPVEPLVIDQYTGGYWSTRYNEETGEEETYYAYDVYELGLVWKAGNVINLTRKDGTVEVYTYTYNTMDFTDSSGKEFLDINLSYDSFNWDIGSNNTFTIECNGKSCDVNVTIVENTSIIRNNTFVAEKVSDDTCVITSITVSENFNGIIDIPEEIDGYNVVGIEDGVLWDVYGLKELNLPSTFNMISENLFRGCYNLEAVNVSEENTVFASVNGILYNKAFTEILYCPQGFTGDFVIKAGVTELSSDVIACLSNADSVEIESGNVSFAFEDDILYNADFTKIYKAFSTDTDYVMKSTVTEVADYSFSGNDTVETVVFSAGVTEISYAAFSDCSALSSVELPDSLVSIGESAFSRNVALSSITLPDTTKSVGANAFYFCPSLKEVNLNEGLESLGYSVFFECGIEQIVLPNSLTTMGEQCFTLNYDLSDVVIGTGLESIPGGTFAHCGSLESIDIPENVTVLGSGSFTCSGLKSISLHDKITTIDGAFTDCSNLTYAYVGSGVRSMKGAFRYCSNLETVELAEGMSGNCDYAFSGCSKLEDIDLPSTVTELSYAQFRGCSKIEEFDIPENLYKVEAHALEDTGWYDNQSAGDVYLEHVLYGYKGAMPENYTLSIKGRTKSIADSAFENRENLVSVEIPYGFKYIGDYAFDGCSGLTGITIPSSVEYIGEYSLGYGYNNGWDITKYEDFTIYGVKDSVANQYADENGFAFVAIKEEHTHNESGWIIDLKATCTTDGSKHKECTECGEVVETVVITATGHTESKWITDKKATVNKAGSKHKECTECGEILKTAKIKQLKCAAPKLSKVTNTKTGVKFTWKKVTGADSYTVYRKTGSGSWKKIAENVKTTSYTDKTAKKGVNYKYTVKAKNEAGLSKYNTKGLSIKRLTIPTLKSVSSAKAGVTFKWNKVTGASGYIVMRKTGNGSWKEIAKVKGNTKVTYLDKTAKKGTTYKYTVKAYYGSSESAYNTNGLKIKDKY